MKKPFNIIKLDRRYTGHSDFKLALEYTSSFSDWQLYQNALLTATLPKRRFLEHRNWFWETYGPSAEIDMWLNLRWMHTDPLVQFKKIHIPVVTDWAYSCRDNQLKLYVKDDAVLSYFLLKHSN